MANSGSLLATVPTVTLLCFLVQGARHLHEKSDFLTVSKSAAFVDKTLFIRAVFQPGHRILITAPRKFGKSTNLKMVKMFLSINSRKIPKIRDIYTTLRIYEDHTFFENNCGKWPVIFMDLSTKAAILCVDDVVKAITILIHRSYKEHAYLLKSENLDEYEKFICNNWITDYTKMQEYDAAVALRNLVRFINKHFKKPVIVLVDGYDDIINSAMIHVGDDLLFERVITFISTILENGLDSKGISVELAVITGVSYLSSSAFIDIKNLEVYTFLEDHPFTEFFGFSVEEINQLFNKTHTMAYDIQRDRAVECYGGYNSRRNDGVLHPHYTSAFVKAGNIVKHSDSLEFIKQLLYLLKFSTVRKCTDILLSGNTFEAKIYKSLTKEKTIELRDLYRKMVEGSPDINLFLSHLMELGYLSYAAPKTGPRQTVMVKLPNVEVMMSIFRVFQQYYMETCHLNATVVFKAVNTKDDTKSSRIYNEKTKQEKCSFVWNKLKNFVKSLLPKR